MLTTDESGSLWVDMTVMVGHRCRLEIMPWTTGISCFSHLSDETVLAEPFETLGLTLSMLRDDPRARPWLDCIPGEILAELVRLERLYGAYHFPALWLTSRSRAAAELFLGSPLLLFALLESARSGSITCDRLLTALKEKRLVLLRLCGLVDKPSCLRLLDALPGADMYPEDLQAIRRFIAIPGWEHVNHLAHIDIHLLKCLTARPALIKTRLVTSYQGGWSWSRFNELCDDILRLCRQLGSRHGYQRIGRCRNLDEVNRLHDRLVLELNLIAPAARRDIVFAAPPLAGNQSILPILDSDSLHQEGVCQRHCIAGYEAEICAGIYYVYRVIEPERATLGVHIDINGAPSIAQLKLKFNAEPASATLQGVRRWFEAAVRRLES